MIFDFAIDIVKDKESFDAICNEYRVEYSAYPPQGTRQMYLAHIYEDNLIDAFIASIKSLNPEILCAFEPDGLQKGLKYKVTVPAVYDENGGLITPEVKIKDGKVKYKIKKDDYLGLMPDKKTYDIDGNETSSTRPTELTTVKNFAGCKPRDFDPNEEI